MKAPNFTLPLLLLLFLLLQACKDGLPATSGPVNPEQEGAAAAFYEQGLKAAGPEEMIRFFDEGLQAVTTQNDSILLSLLEGKVYAYNKLKAYDQSLFFADSLIHAAQLQQDTVYLAKAFYRKAMIHLYLNNPEEIYANAFASRKFYAALKDSSAIGRRTLEMANAQLRMNDYSGSQETATEALAFLDPEEDVVYLSSAHNVIAISYRKQQLYEDALKEYDNVLKYAVNEEDSLSGLNNMALVLRDKGEYPEALAIFEDLINTEGVDNNSRNRYLDNYAYTRWLIDPTATVDTILEEVLAARLQEKDRSGLLASYSHLTSFYEGRDNSRAGNYARDWLQHAVKISSPGAELEALERLINILPPASSGEYVKRFIALNDSLNTALISSKNVFAKIRYDEEQKQQQISRLEAFSALQALETERLRNQRILGILVTLLLLLGTFFIFYYLRQVHKKEKIREVQTTENRISKVIHDELANDIYNVMSTLETTAPAPVVDKLEKIYRRTRDISRENSDIDTGGNYVEHLISTLGNITKGDVKLIIRGENAVSWDKIADEKKIVIYRVLQELMINMKKHSNAKLVALVFSREGKKLVINYTDTGKGADPAQLRTGNGLQNMKNRLAGINGKISFETEPGKGFKAELGIPV